MPINRKDFNKGNFKIISQSQEYYTEAFLRKNSNKAYKTKEISKILKKPESSVSRQLRILVKDKKVIAKKPYYIIRK